MADDLQCLSNIFSDKKKLLTKKVITIGFDGFVDQIVNVIKCKNNSEISTFFKDKNDFGKYILGKKRKNVGFELKEKMKKIGGNMPITANALGKIGIKVNCLGTLGYPEVESKFKNMSTNCKLHSFADPGYTLALEFDDEKILLGLMESLNGVTWGKIKNILGLKKIINLCLHSDGIGLVNWAEIDNSNQVWRGFLQDVFKYIPVNREKFIFFDLADCSKRRSENIREAINLMEQFGKKRKTILSMNKNEAELIAGTLSTINSNKTNIKIKKIGVKISRKINIDILVIHYKKFSMAWSNNNFCKVNTLFLHNPLLLTGGGDNFNAGFCIGQLLGLNIKNSLEIANLLANYYIKMGQSPNSEEFIKYINEKEKKY